MRLVIPLAIALATSACMMDPEAGLEGGGISAADAKDNMRKLFGKDQTPRAFVTDKVALQIKPEGEGVHADLSSGYWTQHVTLKWDGDRKLTAASETNGYTVSLDVSRDGRFIEQVAWKKDEPSVDVTEPLKGHEVTAVPAGPFGRLFGGYIGTKSLEVESETLPEYTLFMRARGTDARSNSTPAMRPASSSCMHPPQSTTAKRLPHGNGCPRALSATGMPSGVNTEATMTRRPTSSRWKQATATSSCASC
jgi:hypothetical protein